uniref:ATP synthase subunit d, mitochondrial n=1 Tax=Acrobeloides nanus TaxID=290746 RepID=A0A914C5P7_9BILA
MKGQNSDYLTQVNSLPSDLPKVDFEELKKQLPAHVSLLDSLKKQVDAIKIPYGEVPKEYNKGVEEWSEYNNTLMKVIDDQTELGATWCKKIEERWAKAPPVEHWNRNHYVEYMPFVYQYYDARIDNQRENPRFFDGLSQYLNKPETKNAVEITNRNYKFPNRFEVHYENH